MITNSAPPQDHVILPDATVAAARAEAELEAGEAAAVGDLVAVRRETDETVAVRFGAQLEGYRGWEWSVTVATVDPDRPTISEVVLLPGPEALLAPEWVPWQERVEAGDLGAGDLLPTAPDDPRVVPAYVQSDDPAVEEVAHELGIGRVRVMSRQGRLEAARRWHRGEFGPRDPIAKAAPATCATCAFFLPLAGLLGAGFGACGNRYSPADGHVVDIEFGCGAHSEVVVDSRSASGAGSTVVDELILEVHQHDDGPDDTDDTDADTDDTDSDADTDDTDSVG